MTGEEGPHAAIPPPAFLSDPAPAAVLAALPGSRVVGGPVRDALAGMPVQDVDIAAPLPPEAIIRLLREAGLKVFETGLQHGTVTAVLGGVPVEVTALRRDVATDGRHAEVEWTTDWREDAARRDFTINAMSLDAAGNLWDWFGGRDDLAAGHVRFVGDPATRLAEDYLRALRFFRFWARYGRGEPDAAAIAAIREAVPGLKTRIAPERIWMELKRLLAAPDPLPALRLMLETRVMGAALPEWGGFAPIETLAAHGAPADPLMRVAALVCPGDDVIVPLALARRLRLSKEERDRLIRLAAVPSRDTPAGGEPDLALRRWLARCGSPEAARDALWMAEARDGRDRAALRARIAAMPMPVFPLQGRDLLALGVSPGPEVGRMLSDLRAWWIAEGAGPDGEACLAEARRRLG